MAPFAAAHFRLSHIIGMPRGGPSAAAAVLAAVAALLWLLPAPAAAHGFLSEPASRNYRQNWQYCPHCVNFGGTWPSSGEGRLAWPRTAQPACGQPDLMRAGEAVATYSEGQVIDISVFISAQHGGRHVFRLCTDSDAQERCLSQHVLERADWGGPFSWTKTSGGSVPGAEVKKGSLAGQSGERYTWRYRLPPGVTCNRCVLQWWWTTANSCRVPGAPAWVGSDTGMLPCTDRITHPEEFRNCADIVIKKRNRGSGGSTDSSGPTGNGGSSAGAAARPAQPAVKPAVPAAKPAGGGQQARGNATAAPQQQSPPVSTSLDGTVPAVQQAQKPRAAAAAAPQPSMQRSRANIDDACAGLGGGLHALPLACPKFLLCAGGKAWVLYCPKGKVWDSASQACVAGLCEDAAWRQ